VRFILDNNISYRIANALGALGEDVRALRDIMPADSSDEAILKQLGAQGWHFVTADKRIRTRVYQAVALKNANILAFFLNPFFVKNRFWGQAVWMVRHWPRFSGIAQTYARPAAFVVQQNGKMSVM